MLSQIVIKLASTWNPTFIIELGEYVDVFIQDSI